MKGKDMASQNKFLRFLYDKSPSALKEYMTSVYSKKRSRIKYGPKYFEYFSELEKSQWLSKEKIQYIQELKIQRLMNYSLKYIPYYKMLFEKIGMSENDIKSIDDLKKIPLLTKDLVRKNDKSLRSIHYRDPRIVERFQTSGTTGKAMDVYASYDYIQMEKAFQWLHRLWGGVKMGDSQVTFVGYTIIPFKKKSPPFWVYDSIENRTFFSLHHMTKENLRYYAEHLEELKPLFITGYPMAISIMATYLLDAGIKIRPLKAVFTASETLMSHQRKIIEEVFKCKVFDWYGQTEFTANIVQCEHGNYHIKPEYGVVEILKSDGTRAKPGEMGEIVATGLNNFAMPFIRYYTGDTAVTKEGKCPCGRGGVLISKITGRVEDIIVTPDGRFITRLDFIFKDMKNVMEAQLVQDTPNHLIVKIVKKSEYCKEDERKILLNIHEHLGKEMSVDLEGVEEIPRSDSGKFRYVISKVPLNFLGIKQPGNSLKE